MLNDEVIDLSISIQQSTLSIFRFTLHSHDVKASIDHQHFAADSASSGTQQEHGCVGNLGGIDGTAQRSSIGSSTLRASRTMNPSACSTAINDP